MTRSKRLRVLAEIYARIPDARCKGLCADACSSIPVAEVELQQLETWTGRPLAVDRESFAPAIMISNIGEPCPLLVIGRCTAYEKRPAVCRLYGVAQGLKCGHGCFDDQIPMSDSEAMNILYEIRRLS